MPRILKLAFLALLPLSLSATNLSTTKSLSAGAPLPQSLPATSPLSVKGLLCDSVSTPESFATIRIYLLPDTIKPAASGVSGEDGAFSISLNKTGNYRANIFSFSKNEMNLDFSLSNQAPLADLGKIILTPKLNELQEVTVTTKRPLVTKEIDRIGYDVQADDESKTSRLDEILKKVPLVSVDPDGTIKVKGSSDFKIYKNGRPNNSFSNNAKDIFKAIPASMIQRIEVITDPGAREDAEGSSAILNIVTLKNTIIKGVIGSIGFDYRTNKSMPTPHLWLETQIDKFTISGYGGYEHTAKRNKRFKNESLTIYDDSGNHLFSVSEGGQKSDMGYFGVEASLEPDSLNLISADFNGHVFKYAYQTQGFTAMTDVMDSPVYSYSTITTEKPNRYFTIDGRIDYQRNTRRKGETLTLSYMLSSTNQSQHNNTKYEDEVNLPVPYNGIHNEITLDFLENTVQFDWTRPINKYNKFDVGAKYIHRNNHSINDQDYFNYLLTLSDFNHLTQVFALYGDYRLLVGKIGARIGLRYEFSRLSAKYNDGSNDPFSSNLNDLVPNASFSYNLSETNTLKLSYSTRINRPGIRQLNPARTESPSSISEGNPDLKSSLSQSVNLNFNHIASKFSFDFNASYSFVNNGVISVIEMLPGDIRHSTYANSGKERWWNLALWVNYFPTSKTALMVNAIANYYYSSNPSLDIKNEGWGSNVDLRVRQMLPWGLALTANWSIYQPTPTLYSSIKERAFDRMYYGLTLQKSFLKERRLSMSLSIMNPFARNTTFSQSTPKNGGYSGYTRSFSFDHANNFGINISYRFGSLNAEVKKTNTTIVNDDVNKSSN